MYAQSLLESCKFKLILLITFWAGFFPTEYFSKDKKNTKAPDIALAKLSPSFI